MQRSPSYRQFRQNSCSVAVAGLPVQLLLCVAFVLSACATPQSNLVLSDIDSRELRLIQIAREATANFTRSRFVDARLGFETVLFFEPQLRNVRENLARVYTELELYDEARAVLLELLDEHPDSFRIYLSLAANAQRARQFEVAKRFLDSAEELATERAAESQLAQVLRSQVSLSLDMGDLEEAESHAFVVYQLEPSPASASAYVRALLAQEKVQTADRFFRTQQIRDPALGVYQAMTQIGLGEFAEADALIQRTLPRVAALTGPASADFQLLRTLFSLYDFSEEDTTVSAELREDTDPNDLEGLRDQIETALNSERAVVYPALLLELLHEVS